jgi:hypothetical protein
MCSAERARLGNYRNAVCAVANNCFTVRIVFHCFYQKSANEFHIPVQKVYTTHSYTTLTTELQVGKYTAKSRIVASLEMSKIERHFM